MSELVRLITILTGLDDPSLARQLGVFCLQGKLLVPSEYVVKLALDVVVAIG